MSTNVDNREEAETNLTIAAGEAMGSQEERYYLAAALVHATIYAGEQTAALVEQQRLGNLITVSTQGHKDLDDALAGTTYVDAAGRPVSTDDLANRVDTIDTLIREGLGLS